MIQLTLTLKMTTAQVVEMSVTVNNKSPIQDSITQTIILNLLMMVLFIQNWLMFLNFSLFNPFAPEPPVTARADPGPFYPL